MMNLPVQGNYWGVANIAMGIGGLWIVLGLLFVLVIIALKGYSLWHAAKRNEKAWFIVLLLVNTLGILELIYLYFIVKKWHHIS